MKENLDEIFGFTDIYIVLDHWESSYCYYPKEDSQIGANNPPRLITKEQKPHVLGMLKTYKKTKLDLLKTDKTITADIINKLMEDISVKSIFREEILDTTNIKEEQLDKLLNKTSVDKLLRNHIRKNIELYATEENLFVKSNIKDVSFEYKGKHFRTYEMKGSHGTQIVCRQTFNKERKIDQTGLDDQMIKYLLHEDLNQGGLILLCGSNGSGKSTTCAAVLKERLEKHGGYCITLEDPIEIPLEGQHGNGRCVQIQVNPKEGFAPKIREILRAYPTGQNLTMLIGEIRDADTATQALRSAIDGRLVISTIHADSPQSALKRLMILAAANLTENGARDLLSNSMRITLHQSLSSGSLDYKFLIGNKEVSNYIKKGEIDKTISEEERQKIMIKMKKEINFFE